MTTIMIFVSRNSGPSVKFRISRMMHIIWLTVFDFPHMLAAMTIPWSEATRRKPLMMNSRAMMMMTIHAGSCLSCTMQIRAEQTRSLSARGSMNLPKFVTRLYFLAMWPSR